MQFPVHFHIKSLLTILLLCPSLLPSCLKHEVGEYKDIPNSGASDSEFQKPYTQEEMDRVLFIPGSVIVKLTSEAADAFENGLQVPFSSIEDSLRLKNAERLFPHAGEYEPRSRKKGLHQFYIVNFDADIPLSRAQKILESIDCVEAFEKRNTVTLDVKTNDSGYSYLWEYSGTYSIHTEEAWEYTMGDPSVIVCVVDGGIKLDHEDLKWNCGTDNYNFVRNNTTITADEHGTHVAGTIAGVGNNKTGIAGIAGGNYQKGKRGTTILSAQVFEGKSSASNFQNAIKWGADHGAVISQNSWGNDYDFNGDGKLTGSELEYALSDRISPSMAAAVDYFIEYAGCDKDGKQKDGSPMKGGIVVFAAGNDGIANGVPSSYEPIIAVGSTGRTGRLSSFSNHGTWVDICAPGEYIYSTIANGGYGQLSGTSMACPHVSGVLALLLAQFGGKGFTNDDLVEILLKGANSDLIAYSGKSMGPYLDILGSMEYGIDKYKRENNNPPVIETEYGGDFKFRQWEQVSIPFHISDIDGDKVNVTAEIEGRARFSASDVEDDVYYFELMCELVKDFAPKKVKITASDYYGGVAQMEFTYQVQENRSPELSNIFEDVVMPASGSFSLDISRHFYDPDEEELNYLVSVTPSGIVKAVFDGGNLKVTKMNNGMATITVSAKDYIGAKASASFKVLSRDENYEIDYYPNPVMDFLNIRTSSLNPVDVSVVISSSVGVVLFESTITCRAFEPGRVDMTGFAPGQYNLEMKFGEKSYNYLIVKR